MAVTTALLAKVPWVWRFAVGATAALAVAGAFGLGLKKGFDAGYEGAAAKGVAAVAELERDFARRHAAMLDQYATRLRQEAERALQAGAELAQAKEEHATIQQYLHTRLAVVTRDSVHRFSPDFVRLFNEAVGAVSIPDPSGFAGTFATAGSGTAVVPRVWEPSDGGRDSRRLTQGVAPERHSAGGEQRRTAAVARLSGPTVTQAARVSERDVLAYIIYYGKRCRDMEAQLTALVRSMGGLE